MTYYRQEGLVARKRHTQLRRDDGQLYHEELMSTQGFDGQSSLLYHVSPPTEIVASKPQPAPQLIEWVDDIHRPHRFRTDQIQTPGDFHTSRVPCLFNDDVVISVATPDRASDALYRNGDSDELVLVHAGSGQMHTQFGVIEYEPLDFIHIPRGTIVDWRPNAEPQRMVILESLTDIRPPSRYLTSGGQFLEASPYCERDLKVPKLGEPRSERGSFEVLLKTRRHITSSWLEHHPFDVVGWDGCYYPSALNAHDFEPIVQRIHTMPNMHQAFATEHAAICVFVPRVADYHPLAIPAAPHHSSVDCDEMLYLIEGAGLGRVGDGPGSMTFHPRGIPHGPKPGTYEASIGIREHSMYAFMVDTFRPLRVATTAVEVDDAGYPASWIAAPS